ncbi:hypothetical protein MesoLj131c_61790 [Mesorhizobium sp. 131-3-5]|uniref:hypothetical protein n=1 Tax=Mesorhizobium sp. 131-3-5 TaxID=2744520 RepID=UPI0019382558|nr:hypothetical protein [Mesorhizobium sp. 131-3-5]BCH11921.1 hypothetical protein MesoLj131c_61790 [Mesorhizobium sp. 131-3-5]
MIEYRCTWWAPTDRERYWLRRYTSSDKHKCVASGSYCNAMFEIGEDDILYTKDGYIDGREDRKPPVDDPRWPTACGACGRPFAAEDPFQLFGRQVYVCEATGERTTLDQAPVGSCWDAWWISERRKDGPTGCGYMVGPDHRSLVVRLPGNRDWQIDSRASNCTMPDDNEHFCWVRHGSPEDGTLHVDKNGHTCAAGAGSIAVPDFHGFLHHGVLRDC